MNKSQSIKGRGAITNPGSRYLRTEVLPVDDGWSTLHELRLEELACAPETELRPDKTTNIISTNESPDIPFNQSINPYKGCEHGCVYCYARPTHAYLDLSPGLDFETKIYYKTEPAERLREAFSKKSYVCEPIALGTNTDPYQPAEKNLSITRKLLETCLEFRNPVTIVTKGVLILRDLDVLKELANLELVSVAVSVTTLQSELKAKLEPRTASPVARLRVIRELAQERIPVGVMVAPIIPSLTDHEIEEILEQSARVGAQFASYVILRLPLEVAELFEAWLQEHYPLKANRVLNQVREVHDGQLGGSGFGERMTGSGVFADLIRQRFKSSRQRLGLVAPQRMFGKTETGSTALRTDLFRRHRDVRDLWD